MIEEVVAPIAAIKGVGIEIESVKEDEDSMDIPDDPAENFAASPNIGFTRSITIDEKGANFKKIFI